MQLRAMGQVTNLQEATERAKLLITVDEQYHVAAITKKPSDVDELKDQIASLQEQVAALATSTKATTVDPKGLPPLRCYQCNRLGHMKRDCPTRNIKCFKCHRLGHITRYCCHLNDNGTSQWGYGRPSQ